MVRVGDNLFNMAEKDMIVRFAHDKFTVRDIRTVIKGYQMGEVFIVVNADAPPNDNSDQCVYIKRLGSEINIKTRFFSGFFRFIGWKDEWVNEWR